MADRPNSPQAWAAFYQEQADKRAAVEARDQKQAAKNERPPHEHVLPHPLVGRPSFPAGTPDEIQERHIASHLFWRDHGAAAVQAHRDAQAAEAERARTPHPMTQPPFVHIPVPGSLVPKNSPRKPPTLGKSIK
jgi:hypothetical protein